MSHMMQKLTLSCSAFALGLCASHSASAQDTDWIKAYIGASFGVDINTNELEHGAFSSVNPAESFGVPFVPPFDSQVSLPGNTLQKIDDSIIGGALAGWNFFQSGNIIIGFEGDFNWTGANSSSQTSNRTVFVDLGSEIAIFNETLDLNADVEWKATLRGRIGQLVSPNFLLFLTGGVAFGEIAAAQTSILSGERNNLGGAPLASFTREESGEDNNIHVGFVGGGGGELQLTDALTGRIEALYIDLGSENYDFGRAGSADIDASEIVIRAAITFDLN